MRWVKKGLIFVPDSNIAWMVSHASIPIPDRISDDVLRIYFATRDAQGRSLPAYLEVDADDPQKILYVHDRPVLPLGKLGTFDDSGVMPSWLVSHERMKYLYYIGWNPQVTVPYRLSIGLAISRDGGTNFDRLSDGPLWDRDVQDPYFCTAPCVLKEGNLWRMWYVSCTSWDLVNDRAEPRYHIKYAESSNGSDWRKTGLVCIDYDDHTEAIGRPSVFVDRGGYKMLYSHRRIANYRTDPEQSYRLGYAESADGLEWTRKDTDVGIARSSTGWDSQMLEYCHTYEHRGRRYLLYNGNGFGGSGFGYAVLDDSHG